MIYGNRRKVSQKTATVSFCIKLIKVLYKTSKTFSDLNIFLKLIPNTSTKEFIKCLKRLIARRGKSGTIYSDNAKSFQAVAKWLKQIIKSEQSHEHLTKENINWKFNLPKAPWWGGHFERLIGVIKQVLYKSLGRTSLCWSE